MTQKIKIIGGASQPGKITILSNKFTATTTMRRDGNLTCTIKPLPKLYQHLINHPRIPIPRTLILAARIITDITNNPTTTIRDTAIRTALTKLTSHIQLPRNTPSPQMLLTLTTTAWTVIRTARWHGAEHMTIAAYTDHNTTDLDTIKRQNPVNDHCGGRLAIPTLALTAIAMSPLLKTPAAKALFLLGGLETILWVDKLIGLHRVPVLAQASTLLQRYITTRYPQEIQLRAARLAITELLAAHTRM